MKQKRLCNIQKFAIFVVLACLLAVAIIQAPQKKVKATNDEELYYFDCDLSIPTSMSILLYVYDVANLDVSTCTGYIECYTNIPPYKTYSYSFTCDFVRDYTYDYLDWDCYRYTLTYPNLGANKGLLVLINSYNVLHLDNNVYINYSVYLPYYPTYKAYYDEGYDTGYDAGATDTTNALNEYWQTYIQDTYINTTGTGYRQIFQAGYDAGFNEHLSTNWVITIINTIGTFLEIEFFPGMTFGVILGVPFIISLAWFIIRMFRGGGGD